MLDDTRKMLRVKLYIYDLIQYLYIKLHSSIYCLNKYFFKEIVRPEFDRISFYYPKKKKTGKEVQG